MIHPDRTISNLLNIRPPTNAAKYLQTIGAEAIQACIDFCETEDIRIAKKFCDAHKAVDMSKLQQGMDDFYDSGLSIEQMDAVDDAFFSFSFLREKANAASGERRYNE